MAILLTTLVLIANTATAENYYIKPGETFRTPEGDSIICSVSECVVSYQYVGKSYVVKLPNGKIHFQSQTKADTLNAAKELVQMKACDRLKIDINDLK